MPLLLCCSLLGALSAALLCEPGADAAPWKTTARKASGPTVYLAHGLSSENVNVLGAALAANDPAAVLLIDTPAISDANKAFLAAFKPERVVPVGDFSEDAEQIEKRLGCRPEAPQQWTRRPPASFWREYYPHAETVVVCPPEPRGLMLQGACLAGVLKAPLYITSGQSSEKEELQTLLQRWSTKTIHALGDSSPLTFEPAGIRIQRHKTAADVAAAHQRLLADSSTPRVLVVANPADGKPDVRPMSVLAPWIALKRNAALILTASNGKDVEEVVNSAVKTTPLRQADTVILVADQDAIPVITRKNPIPTDKDEVIEMEPLTPADTEPFSFCVGRMFHQESGVVLLMLARRELLARLEGAPKALIASNTDGNLPLLETISRQTVRELKLAGYDTKAFYGSSLKAEQLRKILPEQDIFLWEGHHNTLIRDWKFPHWDEPLRPSLIFLQSCLGLREWKVQPLFQRGAVGVIGSSTRTYSASGGAASLAFFDAILYDDLPVGEALRQSKNFLQAYVMLKEGRLGDDAKRTGANQRTAWAFTLWGDPTARLPRSARRDQPAVRHTVKGNTILVRLPDKKLETVHSEKYHADIWANMRLAGLTGKEKKDEGKSLQGMVFAEVYLPHAPEGKVPRLSSKLPSRSYVFNWDARRRCGYLLAVPREKDTEQLRFTVHWEQMQEKPRVGAMRGQGDRLKSEGTQY
jgi:hypothetical protein